MKTVAIVLGVLGVLALAVCGGVFFFGRNLFQSAMDLDAQGKAFATEAVRAVAANWDPAELDQRGSKLYQQIAPKDKIAQVMALCRERLGPLKSVSEFTTQSINADATAGRTTLQITAPAEFEKGRGNFTITVAKEGERWGVDIFSVNSPALAGGGTPPASAAPTTSPTQPGPTTEPAPDQPTDDGDDTGSDTTGDTGGTTGDTGGSTDDY